MNIKNVYRGAGILFVSAVAVLGTVAVTRAALPDPIVNPGFEDQWTAPANAYDWQNFGNGYKRVNTAAHTGSWSIQVTNTATNQMSGAYQRIDLNQTVLKPVFIGGYVKGSNIVNSTNGYFGASIYAEIHMTDGTVGYWNSIANYGTFAWRRIGFNTGTLPWINKPISYIFIVPSLINARGTAQFDDFFADEYTPFQSGVTIMIDDGEDTTYTVAKPAMDAMGFKGSTAIVTTFIGEPGYMNDTQIKELQTAGWEIVSHTETHEDLTTLGTFRQRNEILRSKTTLENKGYVVKNFAMPYGAYNGAILATADTVYSSARAYEQGDNPQGVYSFDIKVHGLLDTTTIDEVSDWLNSAKLNNRWVVLVFHSLTTTGDDSYHTSPAQFQAILQKIKDIGIPVITYDQGIQTFATQ